MRGRPRPHVPARRGVGREGRGALPGRPRVPPACSRATRRRQGGARTPPANIRGSRDARRRRARATPPKAGPGTAGFQPARSRAARCRQEGPRRTSWAPARPARTFPQGAMSAGRGAARPPAFAAVETCGRDARAPRPRLRRGFPRRAAHSPGRPHVPPARRQSARRRHACATPPKAGPGCAGILPARSRAARCRQEGPRRTSWVRERPARTFPRDAASAGRGAARPARRRSRRSQRAGRDARGPGPRLRRGFPRRAAHSPGRPRVSPARRRKPRRCRGRRGLHAPPADIRGGGNVRARRAGAQEVRAFGAALPGKARSSRPARRRSRLSRRAGRMPAVPGPAFGGVTAARTASRYPPASAPHT